MDRLSLHGLDKELVRRISELARREHLSMNTAALLLMRRGANLLERSPESAAVGSALNRFIGRWSAADERHLLASIASCE
jgi:hypothetical protein